MKFQLLLLGLCFPFLSNAQIFTDVSNTHLPQENMKLLSMDSQSGDFDGDGLLDLVVATDGQKNLLLFNQGNGILMRDTARLLPDADTYTSFDSGEKSRAIAIADFDGDGSSDILFVSNGSSKNELLLNDGTGKLTYHFFPKNGEATSIVVLNIGGDTLPDVIIGMEGENYVYINQGNGNFQNETVTFLPNSFSSPVATRDIKLGDLDNDGDLDLVEAYEGIFGIRIFINNGGVFTLTTNSILNTSTSTLYSPRSIGIEDLDNDGDLDIYMGNQEEVGHSSLDQLFLNDGTGVFTQTVNQLPILLGSATDVDFMDMNYDGYIDIMTVNPYLPDSYRIYLNTPSNPGHFTPGNQLFPDFDDKNPQTIHLADFNGDGKKDVFIGNSLHDVPSKATGSSFDKLFLSVLGVNTHNISNTSSLQVFPNPASDYLTIESDFFIKKKTIQLFNTNGRMVKNIQSNKQEQESIMVNNLPNGVYFLNVLLENGQLESRKVLIQR